MKGRLPQTLEPEAIGHAVRYGIRAHDAYVFLQPRRSDWEQSMTPAEDRYAYIASRIDGLPGARARAADHRCQGLEGFDIMTRAVHETVNGRRDALTLIAHAVDELGAQRLDMPPAHIYHVSESRGAAILNDVRERLFRGAMARPRSIESLLPKLAEMHFWLAHAMPDRRGSAAKSEMVVRAIAAAHGFDLPPFKRGFVPDMEAFVTPRREYVVQYALHLEDSEEPPDSRGSSPRHGGEAGPTSSGGG